MVLASDRWFFHRICHYLPENHKQNQPLVRTSFVGPDRVALGLKKDAEMKNPAILLIALVVFLCGCGPTKEVAQPSSRVDHPESKKGTMPSEKIPDYANHAAEAEGYDLKEFAAPKITFDLQANHWRLFYEGIVEPAPGNHFFVLVDDRTGETSVRHGY